MTVRDDDDGRNDIALSAIPPVNAAGTNAVTATPGAMPEHTAEAPASIIEPVVTESGSMCRCFPHGVYGVLIMFLSVMAWLV